MSLSVVDLVVIVAYLVGMLWMGVYFSKRNVTTDEYFLGGRSFKGWVIGLSLVGTSISSLSFVAFPADAFKTSWLRMITNLMLPVGLIAASYFFLPFYRRNKISSAYEYLEHRFGPGVCIYGSLAYIVGLLMRISAILYLVSVLVQNIVDLTPITTWILDLFGIHIGPERMTSANSIACILIAGLITAFYTIIGGITAVIWTDVIQTVLLALGAITCLIVVIVQVPGGLGEIFGMAYASGKFGFADYQNGTLQPVSWDLTLQTKTAAMMMFVGLNVWMREFSCMQTVIQRYSAAKSMHEGRKSLWVVACCSIPIWTFFFFLGTCLWVYYQHYPAKEATQMLTNPRVKPEGILPFFIVHHLPRGLAGLVIAGAWAAAMSTLSSSINSMSQVTVNDVYRRHIAPGRDDRHYLKVSLWVSGVIGVLMVLGAIWFYLVDIPTLVDTTTTLASVLGGGLLGLFMLGMLTTRGDSRAAICGILCTLVFVTWTVLLKYNVLPAWLTVPFEQYYTDLVASLVMFGIGYLAAILLFRTNKQYAHLTIWTQDTSRSTD